MRGVGIEGSDCILGLPVLACVNNCPLHVSFGSHDPALPSASMLLLGWFPHSSQPQELCPVDSLPGHLIPPLVFIPSVNCRLLGQLRACDFENLDKIDGFIENIN